MLPLIVSALTGLWLMASPSLLEYSDPARSNDWIVGPVAASLSVIAISKITRGLRWALLPLGLWQLLAPWALGFSSTPVLNATGTGLLLLACLALSRPATARAGGGWRSLLPGRLPDEA